MSWYKLAKDSNVFLITQQIQQQERNKFTNSETEGGALLPNDKVDPGPDGLGLEIALDPTRVNKIENAKLMNEVRQPINTKATGQGADGKLQSGKDLPMWGDNFTQVSDWNTN